MDSIKDLAFGEMLYNHLWFKKETVQFWNSNMNVKIVAQSYNKKPITDQQRENYKRFKDDLDNISKVAEKMILKYFNSNCQYIKDNWKEYKTLRGFSDFEKVITLREVLFQTDGTTILLFDDAWDDSGIGIQIYPEYKIGMQNEFL